MHYLCNVLVEQVNPVLEMKTFSSGVQRESVKNRKEEKIKDRCVISSANANSAVKQKN